LLTPVLFRFRNFDRLSSFESSPNAEIQRFRDGLVVVCFPHQRVR
jgi:hypothetical protein